MNRVLSIDDLMADIVKDTSAAEPIKPQIQKEEPTETLAELESNWRMANKKAEEEKRPTPKYQERSVPFNDKEEVLDYWRDHTVSEPYINVIMENVFGVPHEIIYDYEREYTKMGKIPVRVLPIDQAYKRIELWGRVLATLERNNVEPVCPTFKEDVECFRRKALAEVSNFNASREKREREESEKSVKKSIKTGWRR